jgi:hypothetical protein
MKLYRMKPNCVVDGVSWWTERGSYYGQDVGGAIQTVRLWNPSGTDFIEVLRGSVLELPQQFDVLIQRPAVGSDQRINH